MTPNEIQEEYKKTYDKGIVNHGVRAWYYLQKGLDLVNQFKYLVAGIFAVYYTLKLDDPLVLIILFVVSIPLLIGAGYFHTFKMAKALEWTNMVFSSYFGRYQVDLNEKNTANTTEIASLLRDIKDKLSTLDNVQLPKH